MLTVARPCSGGAGAYSGMASRWASVHRPARKGGRPAGRRRLSAPPRAEQARARRPALAHSHGMTPGGPHVEAANGCPATGRLALGRLAVWAPRAEMPVGEGEMLPYCVWGDVVFCGDRGSQPCLERWGRAAGPAGRRWAGSQAKLCVCVRVCACRECGVGEGARGGGSQLARRRRPPAAPEPWKEAGRERGQ